MAEEISEQTEELNTEDVRQIADESRVPDQAFQQSEEEARCKELERTVSELELKINEGQ